MQQNDAENSAVAGVRFGVYTANNSAIVGKTVDEARAMFASKFGIPDDAAAFNGKSQVDGSYTIKEGDDINWSRASGEKGAL